MDRERGRRGRGRRERRRRGRATARARARARRGERKIAKTYTTAVQVCQSGPNLQHGRNSQESVSRIWEMSQKTGAKTVGRGRQKYREKTRTRNTGQVKRGRKRSTNKGGDREIYRATKRHRETERQRDRETERQSDKKI